MRRAFELAQRGPVRGPNPRVGAVILSPIGEVIGEGWHKGAGTPHAEVSALADARAQGHELGGATIVVSLEPCNHIGRTPACTDALRNAGIARVVYSVTDPNPVAAGGGTTLNAAGMDVLGDVLVSEGQATLGPWWIAMRNNRPFVTVKVAMSLDGRIAAADGTSQWITSQEARAHAHQLRADVDAILVGTGTALADDPTLTARHGASPVDQPLRVVMGDRDIPEDARLRGPGGELLHIRSHDPVEVLEELHSRQVRHLLVEGGPTVATAFLRHGLFDEIQMYIAPVLLGSDQLAVQDLGVATLTDAPRLTTVATHQLGPDTLVIARRMEH